MIQFKKYDVKGSAVDFFAKHDSLEDRLKTSSVIYNFSGWLHCIFAAGEPEELEKFEDWLISFGDVPMKVIGYHDMTLDQINSMAEKDEVFKRLFKSKIKSINN